VDIKFPVMRENVARQGEAHRSETRVPTKTDKINLTMAEHAQHARSPEGKLLAARTTLNKAKQVARVSLDNHHIDPKAMGKLAKDREQKKSDKIRSATKQAPKCTPASDKKKSNLARLREV